MESGGSRERIVVFFRKYRWAAVVVLAGLLLMSLPQGGTADGADLPEETVPAASLEQKLETILSAMEGAGRVRVLLTEAQGEQQHFQMDQDKRQSGDSGDLKTDTVIITAQDRSQQGLIQRTDPPVYRGAVVLCQGADSARVRLAVVEAVAAVTGLTSDKISVLKMK